MTHLKIKRLKEWANRRFSYKILVNGEEQLEIGNGEDKFVAIDSYSTIEARIMWCGSGKIRITEDHNIKEVRVRSAIGPNVLFPLFALAFLAFGNIINLLYPENTAKGFLTGLMIGIVIYALALVTIWRNKFLEIEILTDVNQ